MLRRWRSNGVAVVAVTLLLINGGLWSPGRSVRAQTGPFDTSSLDKMLAPIALYPDSLLAQILMSAGNPTQVKELDKWLKDNAKLKGTALQDAAVKAGFDPSLVALVLFPQVISTMAKETNWTTKVGQAFTSDRAAVFDSIQKLRAQAQKVGTLKDSPQQEVETKTTSNGQQVIVIEPANPQIVYVPQYNTTTVYTQAPTQTVVVEQDNDADVAIAAGLIGFTAGIAIGAAMDNNYYYGPYGWHGGGYMYADAWDDYYDHREDAREDWMDHREDLAGERTERTENRSEQRTERSETNQQQRTDRQDSRDATQQGRQDNRAATDRTTQTPQAGTRDTTTQRADRTTATTGQAGTAQAGTSQADRARTGSTESRGYSDAGGRTQATQRSTTSGRSDAFSGYSSGASERSASSRGAESRSSARSTSSSSRGASRSSGGGGGRRR